MLYPKLYIHRLSTVVEKKESTELQGEIPQNKQRIGDYFLLSLLGRGGFSEVYLGEHIYNHTLAAIKILQRPLTSEGEVKNFINEARTFRLQHPHIMPLLDFGVSTDTIPFFIMEYAPQGTLRLRSEKEGRFSPEVVAKYVSQVASALQYAHNQRVIHRDIKPENMLLRANNTVLLSDFGIASVAHNSQSMSNDKSFSGTLHYMAPEQILGKPQPASDQYALGVVAYEWLCGRRPFQGTAIEVSMQHLSTLPPSFGSQGVTLTPAIESVVLRALAKEPRERFASVQEFSDALEYACYLFSSFASSTYATESPARFAASPTQASSFQRSIGQYSPDPLVINMGLSPAQNPPGSDFSMRPPHIMPPIPTEMVQSHTLLAPPRRRSPLLFFFLILCILTISGIGVLEYINISSSNQVVAQKKLLSITSPVVKTIPTATVVGGQDTPTTMLQAIEAVQPDYQDSLTDATNSATIAANWDDTGACVVSAFGYKIASRTGRAFCHELGKVYTNSAIRVTLVLVSAGSAALLFRDQDTTTMNGAYIFEVGVDGHYKISRVTDFDHPLASGPSLAIRQGAGASNELAIIAQGQHLSFFINSVFVTQIINSQYTQGAISLAIFGQKDTNATAYFKNLSVWIL